MDNQVGIAKHGLEMRTDANKSLNVGHLALTPEDWKAADASVSAHNKLAPTAFPLPYLLIDSKIDSRCFAKPETVAEPTNSKSASSNLDDREAGVTKFLNGRIQRPGERNAEVGFYSQEAKQLFPQSEDARNAAYRVGMYEAGVDNYFPSFFKDKAKIDELKPGSTKSLAELAECRRDYQDSRR